MRKKLLLGCIADDFTGASDAASFLVKSGMKTLLQNGVPKTDMELECDAVVVALKTRSESPQMAVENSLKAIRWLEKQGAIQYYSKYCSTFDSTPQGNIGPVLDAALELLGEKAVILCPALPINGRTVKEGKLYVNGVLLHESSMKNHPLNPMWSSDLEELMKPQGKYKCMKISEDLLNRSQNEIWEAIHDFGKDKRHFYIIPDYSKDIHAKKIAEVFGHMKMLSGGSGILTELGLQMMKGKEKAQTLKMYTDGAAMILAGSCSVATREQIQVFIESGHYSYKIDPIRLLKDELTADMIWEKIMKENGGKEILIYSSDSPENVKMVQNAGKEKIATILEQTMARLAVLALESGRTRLIVAGGETSGAVTQALGFDAYLIGESIAPGVPIMTPVKNQKVRLVLKSGNFGQQDFFIRALEQTKEK